MKRIIEVAKQLGSHAAKKRSCPTIKGFSSRVRLYAPK